MGIRVTRPGRKHRIGNAHIIAAATSGHVVAILGDAVRVVGLVDRGIELEIVMVPDDRRPDGWAVIHAMPTWYRSGNGGGEGQP